MQESNQGLLRCRQILYSLSHQGSKSVYIYIYISDFIVHSRLYDLHQVCTSLLECWSNQAAPSSAIGRNWDSTMHPLLGPLCQGLSLTELPSQGGRVGGWGGGLFPLSSLDTLPRSRLQI